MGRKLGYLLLALSGVAVAVVVALAEPREVVRARGFVGEARRNPLLALERTCAALGADVRPFGARRASGTAGPGRAPRAGDAVLVLGTGAMLGEAAVRDLLRWVEAEGGRLVVALPSAGTFRELLEDEAEDEETRDPLLVALDIELHAWRSPELDGAPLRLELPDGRAFGLAVQRRLHLYPRGDDWLTYAPMPAEGDDDEAVQVLQLPHGGGTVTVFAESEWLENGGLGELDHAELAWALLAPRAPDGVLWILRDGDVPGLGAWLTGRGWPVLAGGLVLLVLTLWRVTRRFGPPLPELPRDRRDFGEHLDACGRLLWRHGGAEALLAPLRADLRARIGAQRRDLAQHDGERLADALAAAAGLTVTEVRAALSSRAPSSPQEFTRTVQCLRALRDAL